MVGRCGLERHTSAVVGAERCASITSDLGIRERCGGCYVVASARARRSVVDYRDRFGPLGSLTELTSVLGMSGNAYATYVPLRYR
jgi:hypothetical protein